MNFSKQRESVLNYLKSSKKHPTAEQIYADLKLSLPNLSLATVYRNLGMLCQMGQVVRLSVGDKQDHYDADVSDHQHFVCTTCGGVSDLFFRLPQSFLEEQMDAAFSVEGYQLFVYGTCSRCGANQEKRA